MSENQDEGLPSHGLSKNSKMLLAVTIHNVPERLSVGIAFGVALASPDNHALLVELHHEIKDAIAIFVKDAPQSDGITFITLKYRGDNYSYVEKEFPAKKEKMPQVLSFISDFTEQHNCPLDFVNKVTIVGDELFSNIIKHGYENGEGLIYVRLLFDEDKK